MDASAKDKERCTHSKLKMKNVGHSAGGERRQSVRYFAKHAS